MNQQEIEQVLVSKTLDVDNCTFSSPDFCFDKAGIRVYCCKAHKAQEIKQLKTTQEWANMVEHIKHVWN